MPYHTDKKPKNSNKLPSMRKQNIINKAGLTPATTKKLLKHANHHTLLHLNYMILSLKKKKTFLQSHKYAINKEAFKKK